MLAFQMNKFHVKNDTFTLAQSEKDTKGSMFSNLLCSAGRHVSERSPAQQSDTWTGTTITPGKATNLKCMISFSVCTPGEKQSWFVVVCFCSAPGGVTMFWLVNINALKPVELFQHKHTPLTLYISSLRLSCSPYLCQYICLKSWSR